LLSEQLIVKPNFLVPALVRGFQILLRGEFFVSFSDYVPFFSSTDDMFRISPFTYSFVVRSRRFLLFLLFPALFSPRNLPFPFSP